MNKTLICLALSCGTLMPAAATAAVSVSISVNLAPPMLPVYMQPAPPADDFLWMPGYWAYDDGYFWVPGTWVMAPQRGYLWTPGYWSWDNGLYYWHRGYWGPYVGFYGGVYYGHGYYGSGYSGGRWQGDHFYYNRSVNNVSVTNVRNTYNETVINNNTTINRISYNGGQAGIAAQPNEHERRAEREQRREVTEEQLNHERGARSNRTLRASENKGKPPVAATPRPGAFTDREARPANDDTRPTQDRPRARDARQPQPETARPDGAPAEPVNKGKRRKPKDEKGDGRKGNTGKDDPEAQPPP